MTLFSVKKMLGSLFRRLRTIMILNCYDDFTIAEHFRNQGARIGENNRIEIRSFGSEPYLISIGNHCTIAPGVQFMTHDGGVWVFTERYPSLQKFGLIRILDNCFIGAGTIIMSGITIGPNSIVGAGTVVTKDVPENAIVAGNPGKVISSLEKYQEKVLKSWGIQRPNGYLQELDAEGKYSPAYIQYRKSLESTKLRRHLLSLFLE